MEPLIIALHILVSIAIVALILLQQGKGAEVGASFGSGGSQTLFGSSGSGNFLSHTTAILVAVFFVTSFGLSMLAKSKAGSGHSDEGIPSAAVIEEHNKDTKPAASQATPAAEKTAPVGDAPTAPEVTAPAADVPAAPETSKGK
jgi:preprotein translocase subunit SecG